MDSTTVYWLDLREGGAVMKVPRAGGTAVRLAPKEGPLNDIALGAADLYWTVGPNDQGAVRRAPKDGGPPVTIAQAPGAFGIAVEGDHIYWSELTGTPASPYARHLVRAGLGGEGAVEIASDVTWRFVVDESHVYYGAASSKDLVKVPVTGGEVKVLARNASAARLAEDAANVYWWSSVDQIAWRVSKAGGSPVRVTPAPVSGVMRLAVDATHLYLLGNTVERVALASGTVTTTSLYTPGRGMGGIASDGLSVVWTAGFQNAFWGIATPGTCEGGSCSCPAGYVTCSGACVDPKTNPGTEILCPGPEGGPVATGSAG